MKQVLKRFEIIKNCIAIEDEETVDFQIEKLLLLDLDKKAQDIVALIKNSDFEHVVPMIDTYLKQFNSIVVYGNDEIQGLKLELKILEKELTKLSYKLEEYHNLINDFNSKYHIGLGSLLEEILVLREEYFEFMYKKDKDFKSEYIEAKKDYEDFHEELKKYSFENPVELSKRDKKELKRIYKKASRMCHPDIVEDEKKDKAELIFKELNGAYQQNDLKRVSQILEQLTTGESFTVSSEAVFDKNILKNKIALTREKIKKIKLELEIIKKDDTFLMLQKIENIEEYLFKLKDELKSEKENIMNKMREFSSMV